MSLQNIENLYDTIVGGKALLIGNGKSREGIDLKTFSKDFDVSFGCNAIYLDFSPDFMMTPNQNILNEYVELKLWKESTIFYDGMIEDWRKVKPERFYRVKFRENYTQQTTGYALADIIARMGFAEIYLMGMDFDESNIYRGRHFQYSEDWKSHPDAKEQFAHLEDVHRKTIFLLS